MLDNKGFTLVEVLAVVVIIAILGMIAIPSVISIINTSKENSYNAMISNVYVAGETLYEELENGIVLNYYDSEGNNTENQIVFNDSSIEINLQSLVSNGLLGGTNDSDNSKHRKRLINPKTKDDIGHCMILIKKEVDNNGGVKYSVLDNSNNTNDPNNKCPSVYKEVSS